MLHSTKTLLLAGGLLLGSTPAGLAQDAIDLGGMDCGEQALHLREIIENNETQADEAERLRIDVTTALAECRNGDEDALRQVASRLEGREWNLDVDRDG